MGDASAHPGAPRKPAGEIATLAFPTARAWERWLDANHSSSAGIWMRIAKKAAGVPSVSYGEAVDVALCYGWIDGQKAPLDDQAWLQRFTPRRPRSRWSKANRERAEALLAAGRMAPAGRGQVELAQRDGRWAAAYEGQARAEVPEDLREALTAAPGAADFFSALDSGNRYAILYRIHDAKRPETRARRIAQFVEMLAKGQKIHDR